MIRTGASEMSCKPDCDIGGRKMAGKTENPVRTSGGQADQTFARQFGAMRRARRLTLDQVAQASGLDKSYLSRLERAQKAPSIATVMKVAQALDVPVSALFGETIDDASIHVVRAVQGATSAGEGVAFTPLSQAARHPAMEAFLFHPGADFEPRGQADHGGVEMIFVVEGGIEIRFADRIVGLAKGDFIQFPGHLSHQLRRTAAMAAVLIVVSR